MNFILKHRGDIFIFTLITATYFFFRLIFLTNLSFFNDETSYIRWAQIITDDKSQFLSLPLKLGRQPLFVWFVLLFMQFIKNPVLAGRLVSVIAGFFTLLGLIALSNELFKNKKIGFLTAFIYIFYPFSQVHDRIILLDSMVCAFAVWSLYFAVRLVQKINLKTSLALGIILGGGLLTKTNAIFNVYLLPLTLLLFNFKTNKKINYFLKLIFFIFIAIFIAQALTLIMKLQPSYRRILDVNGIFIYPFRHWIELSPSFIAKNFLRNILLLSTWFLEYAKITYIILIFASFLFLKKYLKQKLVLFLYFFLPLLALSLFGRLLFPRYILPMTINLLPLCGLSLFAILDYFEKKLKNNNILKQPILFIILFVFLFYSAYVSLQFTIDPKNADIPAVDRFQYNSLAKPWTEKSAKFFTNQAKNKKIFIGQEGFIGWMPYALEIYLYKNKNIILKSYDPQITRISFPKEATDYAKTMSSFFVSARFKDDKFPKEYPLELIYHEEIKVKNKDYYYSIYRILP